MFTDFMDLWLHTHAEINLSALEQVLAERDAAYIWRAPCVPFLTMYQHAVSAAHPGFKLTLCT